MAELRTGSVPANGITFHYLELGEGPLVLCLHGFPDNAYTYRYLLPVLAAAGFRGVAPFMRGYAPTSAAPRPRRAAGRHVLHPTRGRLTAACRSRRSAGRQAGLSGGEARTRPWHLRRVRCAARASITRSRAMTHTLLLAYLGGVAMLITP